MNQNMQETGQFLIFKKLIQLQYLDMSMWDSCEFEKFENGEEAVNYVIYLSFCQHQYNLGAAVCVAGATV